MIEKELTSGNHISSHLYQLSSEKKYVVYSKENSKYRKWEEYLHKNFPFDLTDYSLRTLTTPSPGGVEDPVLYLVSKHVKPYNLNDLKLYGLDNKHKLPIDIGIGKKLYDIGKYGINSTCRCCFTYESFLQTNHFLTYQVDNFFNTLLKYCDEFTNLPVVCFNLDETGEMCDDTIHIQYYQENGLLVKNLAKENSTLKKFLIDEYGVVKNKIDLYKFDKYYQKYYMQKDNLPYYKLPVNYIKISISETQNTIVKFYRYSEY